jgi:hypothetical protein
MAEIKVPTIGTVEGGIKHERESEVLRQAVTLSSWGAVEQTGGWRFHSTAAQPINTNIAGLTALVVFWMVRRQGAVFVRRHSLSPAWLMVASEVLFFSRLRRLASNTISHRRSRSCSWDSQERDSSVRPVRFCYLLWLKMTR